MQSLPQNSGLEAKGSVGRTIETLKTETEKGVVKKTGTGTGTRTGVDGQSQWTAW